MPDLSNLKLVDEVIEVADDSTYVDAQEFPPPIPEGTYTFIQGKPEFKATDKGALGAVMTHVVTGGEQDGAKLAFDRISDKTFERQGVKVSQMADHIRAVYPSANRPRPRSHADYAQALEAAEGKTFKAAVSWEAGCNHADTPQEVDWSNKDKVYRVKGARNMPQNGNGAMSEFPCPTCGTTVRVRSRIDRRIAAQ